MGGGERVGGPKFHAFFPSSRHNFHCSFFLVGVFLWNFGGGLRRRGPAMCTFGVLGLSCASPGGPVWWAAGFHTTPNVHISGPQRTKREKEE